MLKHLWTAVALIFIAATASPAHHSYTDYDREIDVTLVGTVTELLWANPHVVVTLQTPNRGEYRVEWLALFQLAQQGIDSTAVKTGDRLEITGSLNKNPDRRILTLVHEVRRPADGWRWVDARRPSRQ